MSLRTSLDNVMLSGNKLKLSAALSMTLDHIGAQIYTDCILFRVLGRFAMPIFAYMIAEGSKYTKNKKRYLTNMLLLAFVCQLVYFFASGSLYQCILVTFSLSIILIYVLDRAIENKNIKNYIIAIVVFLSVYTVSEILPLVLKNTDFAIDYGFAGIMLAVFIYLGRGKNSKLILTAIGLLFLCFVNGGIQWYSMLAIIPLALYNGKRGKVNMKSFFYIYYPLHLVVINLISLFLN